jgi:hypothetical protein
MKMTKMMEQKTMRPKIAPTMMPAVPILSPEGLEVAVEVGAVEVLEDVDEEVVLAVDAGTVMVLTVGLDEVVASDVDGCTVTVVPNDREGVAAV